MVLAKDINVDPGNKIKDQNMLIQNCSHLIFDKHPPPKKRYLAEKKTQHIQQMELGKLDVNKQNESRYVFTILNKISFKWIKVLNLKPEILKELEENISTTI